MKETNGWLFLRQNVRVVSLSITHDYLFPSLSFNASRSSGNSNSNLASVMSNFGLGLRQFNGTAALSRGRFPVLLDDLSKCRTNSQRTTQLRIFYMICTLNDIYKQYKNYTNIDTQKSVHFAVSRTETRLKMHQTYILVKCRALQALCTPQRCELMNKKLGKKKKKKKKKH